MVSFNSTLVRLKARVKSWPVRFLAGFNSTLVRLKVSIKPVIKYVTLMFQFHFGTIKSFPFNILLFISVLVSIPLWYD